MYTFQNFEAAKANNQLETFIIKSLDDYKRSAEYNEHIINSKYFSGNNPTLFSYKGASVNIGDTNVKLDAKIRVPSGIFRRLVTLVVNRIWYNNVQLDNDNIKSRLGDDFNYTAKTIAINAAIHGVCYGFWNFDKLQMFTATEYFPYPDERTGLHHAGVRFWSIDPKDNSKPWTIQLFEVDGWTEWTRLHNGPLVLVSDKQTYTKNVRIDGLGEHMESGENYPGFPVIPLYPNFEQVSELTTPIKQKINLYDAIYTAFGDMVLRTKSLYWIFEGFSGDEEMLSNIKSTIERLGIIAPNDDTKTDLKTVDLPYETVTKYLETLKDEIFTDAMVANPDRITGGNKEIGIKGIFNAEKMKISDMERQAKDFIRRLLRVVGIESKKIEFRHETIVSDMEITQRINMYPELDLETRLRKDPLFNDDEIPQILERTMNKNNNVDINILEKGE